MTPGMAAEMILEENWPSHFPVSRVGGVGVGRVQVKSYFPVYMKHFLGTRHRERQSATTPGCAQCVVCGQELFQRLMSRGLSDRGRLHILFHPLSPLDCLVSLKLK